MKKIGFLSVGNWTPSPDAEASSASDVLARSVDLAVAAEQIGADAAYFRFQHFARQLSSPFPLLSVVGAKTKAIEIGTNAIDMRYENPMHLAENAGSTDLITGGRLQLAINHDAPEQAMDGWRYFGYQLTKGQTAADLGRRHSELLLDVLKGNGFAQPNPYPVTPNPPGLLRLEPHSAGLRERVWWGADWGSSWAWAAKLGLNLQCPNVPEGSDGKAPHALQAEQIRDYRTTWKAFGHAREPRVAVIRRISAMVGQKAHPYFGNAQRRNDGVHPFEAAMSAAFGPGYAADAEVLVEQLAADEAIAEADTLLLLIPNQLGVDFCIRAVEAIIQYVAPALGWR